MANVHVCPICGATPELGRHSRSCPYHPGVFAPDDETGAGLVAASFIGGVVGFSLGLAARGGRGVPLSAPADTPVKWHRVVPDKARAWVLRPDSCRLSDALRVSTRYLRIQEARGVSRSAARLELRRAWTTRGVCDTLAAVLAESARAPER